MLYWPFYRLFAVTVNVASREAGVYNDMSTTSRVGVFGGTFDPIHVGHLIVAEILQYELELDRIIFLPAGRPPHKPEQSLAPDHDRVEMLRLAIRRSPTFSISMIDLERPGFSYTAKSLELLDQSLPEDTQMHFIMGQDSLRDFPNWHRPDLIARQVRLGVALRPGVEVHPEDVERAVPEAAGRIDIVPVPLIGIASRDIRQRVARGKPFRDQVLPLVADYIQEHRLYRHEPDAEPVVADFAGDLTGSRGRPYTP